MASCGKTSTLVFASIALHRASAQGAEVALSGDLLGGGDKLVACRYRLHQRLLMPARLAQASARSTDVAITNGHMSSRGMSLLAYTKPSVYQSKCPIAPHHPLN